jgi:hypothetical protein
VAKVFISVFGGLGNQLFQAAFGVAVEARFGVEVRYLADPTATDIFGRGYMLDHFPALAGKIGTVAEAEGLPVYGDQGVDEASLGQALSEGGDLVFTGYWQNERYFFGQDDVIAAALRLDPAPEVVAQGNHLRASGLIGMHVRRSEYGHHGLAMAAYYRTAIAQIRRETGPAPVACFSDEPLFCEFVFRDVPDLTVMRSASDDPLRDFYLLSRCRHFAIANSSFSWWSAWIGAEAFSIVYAPLPWCAFDPTLNPVPKRWRAIENAARAP